MAAASPNLEALLSHAGLVRAAARAVLGGDPEVEDVVQETWIRALDHGPRQPGALRAWLSRVSRNLAFDALRARVRRRRREAEGARRESVPSTDGLVERGESLRRLVDALLSLEPPYRSALLLRWYDELSVAEVARRLGVPVETARTRLRRGIEQLRARLGADTHRRRRALAVALLPAETLRSRLAISAHVIGGLTVKKFALAAAVLLLGITGATLAWRPGWFGGWDASAPPTALSPRAEIGLAAEPAPTLAASPAARSAAAGSRTPERAPFASGVVVDRDGKPVSGVAVLVRAMEWLSWGGTQERGFEFHRELASPTARSDADGRFRIEDLVKEPVSLVFLKDGWAITEVRGLEPDAVKNQAFRAVLEPGKRFVCNVRDTSGRPIEGARIILWLAADPQGHMVHGGHTTDAAGRCVVDWVRDGSRSIHQLGVGGAGYESRTLTAHGIHDDIEVVLKRTLPVVVVRDDKTGLGIADAGGIVLSSPSGAYAGALTARLPIQFHVDGAGGVLTPYPGLPMAGDGAPAPGSYHAVVFAPGHASGDASFELVAGQEPPRVDVSLVAGEGAVALKGSVDPAGIGLLDLRAPMPPGWGAEGDFGLPVVMGVPVAADGTFSVRGLPSGDYRLTALAPGLAPISVPVHVPDDHVRVTAVRAATLVVTLRRADGSPAPSTWVSVKVEGSSPIRKLMTGDDGVARFEGLPGGVAHVLPLAQSEQFTLSLLPDAHAKTALVAGGESSVEVAVPSRVPVRLRLRDEAGQPSPIELALALQVRTGWPAIVTGEFERVGSLPLRTDVLGEASAELYAGGYFATLAQGDVKRSTKFQVPDGGGVVELAWTTKGATLFGRIVDETSGAPVAGRPVSAVLVDPSGSEKLGQTVTDAEGRYELAGLPNRPIAVSFGLSTSPPYGRRDPGSPYPSVRWNGSLSPGERRQMDIAVLRVKGEGADAGPVELSVFATESDSEAPLADASVFAEALRGELWIFAGSENTGADGRVTMRVLRGERYRVVVNRWSGSGGRSSHERKQVEVSPVGNRVSVEVALSRVAPPVK